MENRREQRKWADGELERGRNAADDQIFGPHGVFTEYYPI